MTNFGITTTAHTEKMEASFTVFTGDRAIVAFGETLNSVNLHVPPSVAKATAEAFNKAMQEHLEATQ